MHVAVHVAGELESRAASALASHPSVERLGLLDKTPPASWGTRVAEVADAAGFEVVVGAGGLAAARAAGAILVVPGPAPDDGPTVSRASLTGLARALADRVGGPPSVVARTIPAEPRARGDGVAFPPPLGWARVADEIDGVKRAPVAGRLAAATARGRERTLAVVDDVDFLDSVCLAAGAFLAPHALTGPVRVWEHPNDYLRACQSLGLVIAETVNPAGS